MISALIRTIPLMGLGAFVAVTLATAGCSSGAAGESDPAETADAATLAVTDGTTSALTSLGGGSPGALTLKEQSSSHSESGSYSCSFNEEDASQTCDCPGGGTVTYHYDDPHILRDSRDLHHAFRQVFDHCVVPACDGEKTIHGEITGLMEGHYDPDGEISVDATVQTAGACSGLTVDDVHVGFQMTMHWDGREQTVHGSLCLDPPGEVVTFNSFEELREAMGGDSSCSVR